ncbi:lipopolysaccharide assembly LapA domain-containing protein [Nocardia thailandica]|uniref:Lipopolysaccharide assembly LapA domain-containing protein n=1 Tax=Nocardia thailandica TaxID=257275 RepID=A0ABW6PS31_9NOCA
MSANADHDATPANADPAPDTTADKPVEPVTRPKPAALTRSRTGYTWTALLAAALLGILLLIFIIQNLDQTQVDLLFWEFTLPLGVMVLLAVIVGALVMGLVGGVRILQLRHAAKRG